MSASLIILHCGKRYEVFIDKLEELTLDNLMSVIETEFNIHRSRQKLIFRGRSLNEANTKLSFYGIKPGSKIMLLGSVELPDPKEIQKLNELDNDLASARAHLESLEASLASYSTFSDGSPISYTRDILVLTEICMKQLEKADSIALAPGDVKQRNRRKSIVDSFNNLINSAEQLQAKLDALSADSSKSINKT